MDTPTASPVAVPPTPTPRSHGISIGAGVAALIIIGGGMSWYFSHRIASDQAAQSTYTAEPTTLPTDITNPNGTPLPSPILYRNSVAFSPHTAYRDLDLFAADAYPGSVKPVQTYEKIGTFTAGPYAGADLVKASVQYEGPGGPAYYRFAVSADGAAMLLRHSTSLWTDPNPAATPERFVRDGAYVIAELQYPQTFTSLDGKTSFKQDIYVTNDWNDYIGSRQLQKAFTIIGVGDVYTDVAPTGPTPTPQGPQGDGFRPSSNGFYVRAPDDSIRVYEMVIPFATLEKTSITWTDGTTPKVYKWVDIGGCGARNYAAVVPSYLVAQNDLVLAGTTSTGDPIWVFKDSNHAYLKDIYNTGYLGAPMSVSFEEFVAAHPVFFWKDSVGRLIKFLNMDFVPQAECGKPVIYLYPTSTQDVSVKVAPRGGMTVSDPAYGQGWTVTAQPNGQLTNRADGKTYPYLFWEGRGGIYEQPTRGWSVAQADVSAFLNAKLQAFGLNAQEIADFKEFWLPRMQGAPYYFITFLGTRQMNNLAPLTVVPRPDTVIRVLMDFSPLAAPVKVQSFEIPTPQRTGFTVVEWGGVLQ